MSAKVNSLAFAGKDIASWLKLPDSDTYTGHCWRRTSATALVDAGASTEELKTHGRWQFVSTAEEYVANSNRRKRKIGSLLAQNP
jgi:integrase